MSIPIVHPSCGLRLVKGVGNSSAECCHEHNLCATVLHYGHACLGVVAITWYVFCCQMGIMVITDVERSDIEFISRTLALKPCAHIDTFTADKLG